MSEADLKHWLGICTFLVLAQGELILSKLDDLNGAISNLQAADAALADRIANLATANDPAIEAATTAVQGVADHLGTLAT